MVIMTRLDVSSIGAALFLAVSLYLMTGADRSSIFTAAVGMSIVLAAIVCLYFSYRIVLGLSRPD